MTKKERAFIVERIKDFDRWVADEYHNYCLSDDSSERDDYFLQYRLDDSSASVLRNLLASLDAGV